MHKNQPGLQARLVDFVNFDRRNYADSHLEKNVALSGPLGRLKRHSVISSCLLYTSQIADWALEAMCWAVQSGLMDGRTETTLVPLGIINRAEAAAMLLRLAAI